MPLSDEERNGLIQVAAQSLRPGLVLKVFQVECLTSMGKNHMTMTSARTGMGKSIVFLVGMKFLQLLSAKGELMGVIVPGTPAQMSKNKSIILVVPYLSLVTGTMSEIENSFPGIKVAHIDKEEHATAVYDDALAGNLDVIIATPEMLCKKKVHELFSGDSDKV